MQNGFVGAKKKEEKVKKKYFKEIYLLNNKHGTAIELILYKNIQHIFPINFQQVARNLIFLTNIKIHI